ncbi:MAG: RluA family pseudouridine synthase [Myxococcales bacterium FL481]|nr:MAG: RluA family pseudouridine synthase [Myxococcales bacterium FL481]
MVIDPPRAEPLTVCLTEASVGSRFDRAVLAAVLEAGITCTRSALSRSFGAGLVRVADQAIRPGATVRQPVEVAVVLLEPEPLSADPEPLPLDVVFEDDWLLVVNKPAGMAVHPGPGHPRGTLVNAVLHHLAVETLPVLPGNPLHRPGLVHRIDRDTSGLLVLARHVRAQEGLARQFREHSIERSYAAIVRGLPSWTSRVVDTPHGRDPVDRRRFAPVNDATRRAISHFAVEESLRGAACLRCRLETGRTHQIRMHARVLGHPLLGDALYGRPPRDERVAAVAKELGRHALHAQRLGFHHPASGELVRFSSPLPRDYQRAVTGLRQVDDAGAGAGPTTSAGGEHD